MKTTEEIYEALLAAFVQRAGFTPEADCDLAVRLYAAAAELQALGIQAEWVLDQSFPPDGPGGISGLPRPDAGRFPHSGHEGCGDHPVLHPAHVHIRPGH